MYTMRLRLHCFRKGCWEYLDLPHWKQQAIKSSTIWAGYVAYTGWMRTAHELHTQRKSEITNWSVGTSRKRRARPGINSSRWKQGPVTGSSETRLLKIHLPCHKNHFQYPLKRNSKMGFKGAWSPNGSNSEQFNYSHASAGGPHNASQIPNQSF